MSLTSQLEAKDSPVRKFLQKYEDKHGVSGCLAELQSSKPIKHPSYEPASRPVWGFIGTTMDYLFRYVANNNLLDLNQTLAGKVNSYAQGETLNVLFRIAETYLDGRKPDEAVVYSATALSMSDNFYRSGGRLPTCFYEPFTNEDLRRLESLPASYNSFEKEIMLRFYDYFCNSLGGKYYAQDILEMIEILSSEKHSADDEFSNATISVFNRTLKNSGLVDGCDFDCVINKDNVQILTDIKTTIKPLLIFSLRQIICYALLHDEKKDGFKIDELGIYYSRSGSFRHLPTESLIQRCLPSLGSLKKAKNSFMREI